LEYNRDGVITLHEPALYASFQDTYSAEEALQAAAQVQEATQVLQSLTRRS
jgi:predicted N-acetyltransferase YhbS